MRRSLLTLFGPPLTQTAKFKIISIVAILLLPLLIRKCYYDHKICRPHWESVEENLRSISNPSSIAKVELTKSDYSQDKNNLVPKPVFYTDTITTEAVRVMLLNLTPTSWDRSLADWYVTVRVHLKNSQVFTIGVSKIKNGKSQGMARVHFGNEHCNDRVPYNSAGLSAFLEKLTNYNGGMY